MAKVRSKFKIKELLSTGKPIAEVVELVALELGSVEEARKDVIEILDRILKANKNLGQERIYHLRLHQLETLYYKAWEENNMTTCREVLKQIVALEGHEAKRIADKIEEWKVKFS